MAMRLLAGTYARLGGPGLVPLTLDGDRLAAGEPMPGIADASFAIWSARRERLFAVTEQPEGRVAALRPAGAWQREAHVASHGAAPCHLALDDARQLLAVANYESGSVALFRIAEDGGLDAPASVHALSGRGPDRERQAGPHAHWVGFVGKRLYCVDLGSDAILCFDVEAGTLGAPFVAYRAPPGSGPRHLAFHPDGRRAYLVSELASTLTVLQIADDGRLYAGEIVSTLPTGAKDSLGGAILLDAAAARLYVTNRGHDSIAVFALQGARATAIQHVPSGGASPRHLLMLDEQRRLLVANEEGGTVAPFAAARDGRLSPIGAPLALPGAVFLIAEPG